MFVRYFLGVGCISKKWQVYELAAAWRPCRHHRQHEGQTNEGALERDGRGQVEQVDAH